MTIWTRDNVTLHTGDVMTRIQEIPAGTVHCVVTSPPYFALRSYLPKGHADKGKEIGSEPTPEAFIATMVAVFREVRRVLRDDGCCFINLGDSYGRGDRPKWKGDAKRDQHGLQSDVCYEDNYAHGQALPEGQLQNIPNRVAEALRQDGWIWRQTIIWAKRSPMPESVVGWRWQRCRVKVADGPRTSTQWNQRPPEESGGSIHREPVWSDCPGCPKCEKNGGYVLRRGRGRCTTAHEYIFLLAKTNRYFWDSQASGEPCLPDSNRREKCGFNASPSQMQSRVPFVKQAGFEFHSRNPRSVWTLSSEPSSIRHFATFPGELVRRCLASSPATGGVCAKCGTPFAPVVESERVPTRPGTDSKVIGAMNPDSPYMDHAGIGNRDPERHCTATKVKGYRPTCWCGAGKTGPTILDPFSGTGTTGQTARHLGCRYIGIELNQEYQEFAKVRIFEPPRWWLRQQAKEGKPVKVAREQMSLFAEAKA